LLDVLRARTDDERPLVRAKALQAFGTALSLRWPRFVTPLAPWSGGVGGVHENAHESGHESVHGGHESVHEGSHERSHEKWHERQDEVQESTAMLLTPDDVSVLMDRCGDTSLAARKQALQSLSMLLLAR
jgi:hypothetical protein